MTQQEVKLSQYLGHPFDCSCGKRHATLLEAAEIGENALEALPGYLKKYQYQHVYVACDSITYQIAGKRVMDLIESAGVEGKLHIFTQKVFLPDEKTLGELLLHMPNSCDLVIAVGTGSINDLCRYLSFRMGRPFFTIATAAPMDGFASSVAALIVDDLKTTYETHTPQVIIGDSLLFQGAPMRMTTAGLGDLIGKFTCLCDWKIARIINNEYYCPQIVELVDTCIRNVLRNADRVLEREPAILGDIMEGLVLTGVAMSFIGNSRPAAGCEHHLSHYWETIFMQQGKPPVLHGTKVGIGTVMILKLVEFLRETPIDFAKAHEMADAYDPESWAEEIRSVYGPAADGIIATEKAAQKNERVDRHRRIDAFEAHWAEISKLLAEDLPSSEEIIRILKALDAPYLPAQVGIDDTLLRNALLYGKEIRARYTMLQMMWDLGVLEPLADRVVAFVNEGSC